MNRWLRSLIAVTVALAALVVPGSPASADSCLDINKTGWHYAEIQNKPGTTGSMVLDVKAWGTTARTPVQLWHNRINECPSWNQVWRIEDRAGGSYFAIISPNGLCLDQSLDIAPHDGAPVYLYPCDVNAVNQWWYVGSTQFDGHIQFVSANDGRCLDVAGYDWRDGAFLQMWRCIDDRSAWNQAWKWVLI